MVDFPSGTSTTPGLKLDDAPTGFYSRNVTDLSISLNGKAAFSFNKDSFTPTVAIRGTGGQAAKPSYSFSTEQNTGLYRGGTGLVSVSSEGVHVLDLIPASNVEAAAGASTMKVMTPATTKHHVDQRVGVDIARVDQGSRTKTISGNTHTIVAADQGYLLVFTNEFGCIVTVPQGLGATFSCGWLQASTTGRVIFTTSGSAVLHEPDGLTASEKQWASGGITAIAENSLLLFGRLAEAPV